MTQDSWPFECTGVGDGDELTMNDLINTNELLGNQAPDNDGVIYWTSSVVPEGFAAAPTGLLAPTNPASDTIRIASGVAIVKGWLYVSDANTDFSANGGAANATDLVVLRRSDPASISTVRLAYKRGTAGNTATVTQTATTWEIAIAQVALNGSGNFSSLTNVRRFARSPLKSMANPLNRQGGSATNWSTIGTTGYSERYGFMQTGTVAWSGTATNADVSITFPTAFAQTPMGFACGRGGTPSSPGDGTQAPTCNITAISTTGMTIHWVSPVQLTDLSIFWQAMGTEV